MDVFLIRHAHAGHRDGGPHDIYRPLSPKGRERANELVHALEGASVGRILSSPATRCIQTVEPLAASRNLTVEEYPDLWEGSRIDHVLALLSTHVSEGLVACSHGDIIPEVIDALSSQGVAIRGRGYEKGSIWLLQHDGEDWTSARHIGRKSVSFNS